MRLVSAALGAASREEESTLPNIKAAIKWVRQTEKRTQRNLAGKSRLRTLYKTAVKAADPAVARAVQGEFDKAATKGIIHPNKAARKKSRLAKSLAVAATSAPKKAPAKKTSRSKK